jgi:tryptophan-rich sensory protein
MAGPRQPRARHGRGRPRGHAPRVALTLVWTVVASLLVVPAASAYIDPGTTSVVFQAVVAGLAAAGTAITMFWSRIISFFRRDKESSGER